jgi:protein gp37
VWLGTSIELDKYAYRADHLRATPAAVRWLSLEPLLGPLPSLDLTGIDWVVAGGESGPGARQMHPAWARDIRDRCVDAGIPFFFKQWGDWEAVEPVYDDDRDDDVVLDGYDTVSIVSFSQAGVIEQVLPRVGNPHGQQPDPKGDPWWMAKVGKKAAGRQLDGRTWDQMPERAGA